MTYDTSCSCTFRMSSRVTQGASASRCENSARCLTVRDFSALNEGVRLQTGPSENIMASKYNCALCERYASSSKYFNLNNVEPPSTAPFTIMGAVTYIQSLSTNHRRPRSSTVALIFAIATILRVQSARYYLSSSSSSLWYSSIG